MKKLIPLLALCFIATSHTGKDHFKTRNLKTIKRNQEVTMPEKFEACEKYNSKQKKPKKNLQFTGQVMQQTDHIQAIFPVLIAANNRTQN